MDSYSMCTLWHDALPFEAIFENTSKGRISAAPLPALHWRSQKGSNTQH